LPAPVASEFDEPSCDRFAIASRADDVLYQELFDSRDSPQIPI
jgi:hypothetical protein